MHCCINRPYALPYLQHTVSCQIPGPFPMNRAHYCHAVRSRICFRQRPAYFTEGSTDFCRQEDRQGHLFYLILQFLDLVHVAVLVVQNADENVARGVVHNFARKHNSLAIGLDGTLLQQTIVLHLAGNIVSDRGLVQIGHDRSAL